MKKLFPLFLFAAISFSLSSQVTISRTLITSLTKVQLDSTLDANGIPSLFVGTVYDIDVYKLIYNTVNYDSTPITASGLMIVPKNISCKMPLVSYQHGTTSRKEDGISRFNGQEALIVAIVASTGYMACAPDYLGLGDGPGMHRYQHAATEATATIDMIRATRESSDSVGLRLNGQVFLTGYSQGGHATMAAHKMIQQKIDNEMHVTASIPMSGAYDMSGVMVDLMLSDSTYPSPSYLAYIVSTWNPMYSLYDTLSRPLLYPYDSLQYIWFDGTHGLGYVDAQMTPVPKHIFKTDTIAAFASDTNHSFRLALKENDVNNWVPTSPVKMLFCRGDHYVPWQNSAVAYHKMTTLGCTMCDTVCVSETLEHQACAQFAVLVAKTFADSFRVIDCTTSIDEIRSKGLSVYPNPAQEELNISGLEFIHEREFTANIFDESGRKISSSLLTSENTKLKTSNLASGIYFLEIVSSSGERKQMRFVKQ